MQYVCEYVNRTLETAFDAGLTDLRTMIPVASLACNQIVLGASCGRGKVEKAPHRLSLIRAESGAYLVRICSDYGLAVPDPLSVMGDNSVIDLRDPVVDLRGKRNKSLILSSLPNVIDLLGESFTGEERVININEGSLEIFGAQIQGVFVRRLNQA